MAVAEARAAWQRAANRCLVQEDAKRAPKLACCSSASPSLRQVDTGPASGDDAQIAPSTCFLPYNRNSSYCDMSPNSRWWLHLQPNYGYQRGLVSEPVDFLEGEMESIGKNLDSPPKNSKLCDRSEADGDFVDGPLLDSQVKISSTCVNSDLVVDKRELVDVFTEIPEDTLNLGDTGYPYEASKKDLVDLTVCKQVDELSLDTECSWIDVEKTEPWWQTADRDELALLVARRSLDFIENCDLPQPQNSLNKGDKYCDLPQPQSTLNKVDKHVDIDYGIYASSTRPKSSDFCQQNANNQQWGNLSFVKQSQLAAEGHLQLHANDSSSDSHSQKPVSGMHLSGDDGSKAQLLEALRHSQTRAREAEKAAKQAYEEKDDVVKLVFRQASQLFAYKQWFQLLQLENLYFQIKNNTNQPISAMLPVRLPWAPLKTKKPRKNSQDSARQKRSKRAKPARPKYDLSRYAVVFALGLGLVGAGLLLGWTVGWMLPTF